MITNFDVIIVGGGLAGFYTAKHLDKNLKVLIITKDRAWDSNSFYAQGGVTVARDESDVKSHIEDTLKAGAYLNDKKAVEFLSRESLSLIDELKEYGFEFDKENGEVIFTKEGAHSINRVAHAGGDATGRELHKFMFDNDNHFYLDDSTIFDLLIEKNRCYGVSVARGGEKFNLYANAVVLASGGIGGLYKYDTNAKTISGEIQGIAIEKGIKLSNMEMTQFHPTVYIKSKYHQKFLLSEALRGEGAKVVDENGDRFLFDIDKRGELASRDIVSRAIFSHLSKGHKVYLDFSEFEESWFEERFPTIFYRLRDYGYKIPNELIPISPAFHYFMGGIDVDLTSKVKGFENLYAVGEVANSGVHGANRLASNSLLECMVFGRSAGKDISKNITKKTKEFEIVEDELKKVDDKKYKNMLRDIMWKNVGIIRTSKGLNEALDFVDENIDKLGRVTKLRFLTAREVIKSAIKNKTSIGAHFRLD